MKECELVFNFQTFERHLNELGYKVSAISTGFYIHNSKGTIVADVHTVDGLRAFVQGVEWATALTKEQK